MRKVALEHVLSGNLTEDDRSAIVDELRRYREAIETERTEEYQLGARSSPGTCEYHPSYATVNLSRVSGNRRLFRSKNRHQHYVSLSISTAKVITTDGHETVMPERELIEVDMSETQFARMITGIGLGSGTPATLNRFLFSCIPDPEEKSDEHQHKERIQECGQRAVSRLKELLAQFQALSDAKSRPTLSQLREFLKNASSIVANLPNNLAYTHEVLHELFEERVDEAKSEIDAYLQSVVHRTGIDVLTGGNQNGIGIGTGKLSTHDSPADTPADRIP